MTNIRREQVEDVGAIHELIAAAFATAVRSDGNEQQIVDRLRSNGDLAVSLVAVLDEVVGHVAFSPVRIGGRDLGWYGLAPVSVSPALQGQGIGARLIEAGLVQLREAGAGGCVVLGNPAYYGRFGFRADSRLTYPGPPPEYFQALSFSSCMPTGEVSYAAAFS